ncbi:MAG: hypothetical protein PHQ19_07625 [Candidatus Krumholzibacteria bacterium]|nr:hypothetical protein [Candidatus Krumholzibacteria bacterium]
MVTAADVLEGGNRSEEAGFPQCPYVCSFAARNAGCSKRETAGLETILFTRRYFRMGTNLDTGFALNPEILRDSRATGIWDPLGILEMFQEDVPSVWTTLIFEIHGGFMQV